MRACVYFCTCARTHLCINMCRKIAHTRSPSNSWSLRCCLLSTPTHRAKDATREVTKPTTAINRNRPAHVPFALGAERRRLGVIGSCLGVCEERNMFMCMCSLCVFCAFVLCVCECLFVLMWKNRGVYLFGEQRVVCAC